MQQGDLLKFKVRFQDKIGWVHLNRDGAVAQSDWDKNEESFRLFTKVMKEVMRNHDYLLLNIPVAE